MKKKLFLILLIIILFTVSVFAQKHQPGDMFIGIEFGAGLNLVSFVNSLTSDPVTDDYWVHSSFYFYYYDIGLTFDYYINSWLSLDTGVFYHSTMILPRFLWLGAIAAIAGAITTKDYITVPLTAHVNIPRADFLYFGSGVNFNFPLKNRYLKELGVDFTLSKFHVGFPMDFGFDFMRTGKGGMRLFYRITPEIHNAKMAVPIGLIWQVWNFKIR